MTTAKQRRLLRELILEGKTVDNDKPPTQKQEKPPKNKLHLNISKFLYMLKRVKNSVLPSKKGKEQRVAQLSEGDPNTTRILSEIWGITKFVVGYGIVGGFILFLALMLLPIRLPLAELIKGSVIAQIAISVLGTGSISYLFYDAALFLAELRKRGEE